MVLRTRVAAACAAAGFLAALSACGAQGSTGDSQPTGSPVTTPPSSAPATTPNSSGESSGGTESAPPGDGTKCTAKDLKGAIEPLDSAPGNRYAELVVTNRTKRPCTLYGYGGLEFIDQDGNPTPTDLTRQPAPGPSLVRLPPGGTAAKKLHWGVVPSGEEPDTGPCEPESAGARIIPPDDTQAFIVTHEFGSVCAGGHVEGSAYFKK